MREEDSAVAPTLADSELKRMLDACIALVREVAQREIIPRFLRVSHGQRKDDGSLCSEADLAAQHFLLGRLTEIRPCPIIGEEMTPAAQQAGWRNGSSDDLGLWSIDPIDGTTNFINGLPCFAVSIAWMRARRARLAVTYNPITDEMFYAREGNGAYLNGRRLPLRQVTADIARAVGGVDFKRIPKELADRIAVSPPFLGLRRRQPDPARGRWSDVHPSARRLRRRRRLAASGHRGLASDRFRCLAGLGPLRSVGALGGRQFAGNLPSGGQVPGKLPGVE